MYYFLYLIYIHLIILVYQMLMLFQKSLDFIEFNYGIYVKEIYKIMNLILNLLFQCNLIRLLQHHHVMYLRVLVIYILLYYSQIYLDIIYSYNYYYSSIYIMIYYHAVNFLIIYSTYTYSYQEVYSIYSLLVLHYNSITISTHFS